MFKVFGVNTAEKGGVDLMGEAQTMGQVEELTKSASSRYSVFMIKNTNSGITAYRKAAVQTTKAA